MSSLRQARAWGLVLCRTCGNAVPNAASTNARCPRCKSSLAQRIPFSTEKTLAWLIAAVVLYIPANVLPVMHTSGLLGDSDSTIVGGIVEFWRAGDWDIALLILIASVVVPFTKFISIGLLLLTVRLGSHWEPHQRNTLYRVVEFIGYWSMLDVIVVAITCSLIQFQLLGHAEPRAGIACFCAVVVFTMLSALSFDPRLIWDPR
jgi:paraquat-inducible protein A